MSSNVYYWKRDLNKFKDELKTVAYIPRYQRDPPSVPGNSFNWIRHSHKSGQLTSKDVENVLKGCVSPPHGEQLFVAAELPQIGRIPSAPYGLAPAKEISTHQGGCCLRSFPSQSPLQNPSIRKREKLGSCTCNVKGSWRAWFRNSNGNGQRINKIWNPNCMK